MQNAIILSKADKIEDAVNAAMLAEGLSRNASWRDTTYSHFSKDSATKNKSADYMTASSTSYTAYTCHYCKKKGHIAKDCRAKENATKNKRNDPVSSVMDNKSHRRLFVLYIDNKPMNCLLDTGASLSILPANQFSATLLPSKRLVLLSGETLENYGSIQTNVSAETGKILCEHEFCIADITRPIIGIDLLTTIKATIDLGHEKLIYEGGTIILTPELPTDSKEPEIEVLIADADFEDVVYLTEEINLMPDLSSSCDQSVPAWSNNVKTLLKPYSSLFSGVGKTDLVQHYINTTNNVPVNLPSYRLPIHLKTKAKCIIQDMLSDGIITESTSEYASPIILVKKKGADKIRMVIDYRVLNAKTVKDAFTCPRIDDLVDKLHNATVFTKLDVRSAYNNIEIAPEDRHKTAFRFEGKLYEYNRVPYGLCTAPATFCRLISHVLNDVDSFTTGFFDDIVIFSNNQETHFKHANEVLSLIEKSGLKLNASKCTFFRKSIEYLGFTISHNSIMPADSKVQIIKDWPEPSTLKEMKRFLGLAGYYRKMIKNFAAISEPLNKLQRKSVTFVWSAECHNAFVTLRDILASSPVVRIANPSATFIVKTDASKYGVGCILEQVDPINNERYVIEYASKRFDKAQSNYPAIEQESFGLIFALKHWCHYLLGKEFLVETDSSTVQWLQHKRDSLGKLGRWSLYLGNFDFITKHIPGKKHVGPDAISRSFPISSIDTAAADWSVEIENDPDLKDLIDVSIVKTNNVYVQNNIKSKIVVPKSVRSRILNDLHDSIGHNGITKTLQRVQERFYWPGLSGYVKRYCKLCHICAVTKDNPSPNSAPLIPINVSNLEPFQMVGMDILGPFPEAKNGEKYLVVMQDYFTKWPEAVALKSVDSLSIQNWFSNEIIPRFGVMNDLITDQGTQFVSASFKNYCKTLGIHCRTTTPFHPMTDGMVEKLNRTFLNMLRAYISDNQTDWPDHLPVILYSYRTAVHDAIKVSPAEALQMRKLRLPIDLLITPSVFSLKNSPNSIESLMTRMSQVQSTIRDQSNKSLIKRKKDYDGAKTRKILEHYDPGQKVYWRKPIAKKGKCPKLSKIWQGPFIVKAKTSEVNYVITDSANTCITVHVNNLKLCNDLTLSPKRIGTRGRPKKIIQTK
jgi:hypothetical protein